MYQVKVKFEGSSTDYAFFVADQIKLQLTDWVVCDTSRGLQLGQVTAFDIIGLRATKWIIQKVDLEEHEWRLKKMLRMKELQTKIKQKVAEEREKEVLKDLGAKYPEIAGMITELEQLGNEISGVVAIEKGAENVE